MNEYQKFFKINEFIRDNIHYCNNDFSCKGKESNSAVLLGLLSGAINGKILYVGEYGLGKTSISEIISSLIFSTPVSSIESSSLKGNPEITYENIIGRPDIGELNKGNEKVIWSDFVLSKTKIIDEINRIPSHKQNILLTGMQTNSWKYLNNFIVTEPGPWFATKNYKDSGNNGIIPPLIDRFDVCVESKSPGLNNIRLIRYSEKINLNYEDIIIGNNSLLTSKDISYAEFLSGIKTLKVEYRARIKKDLGLDLLTEEELTIIQKKINSLKFDNDANYFLDSLYSELGSCQLFGEKRTHETCPKDCHYSNYACFNVKNNLSVRTINSVDLYSKALAWAMNDQSVNTSHIQSILPYVLNHKLLFTEKDILKREKTARTESVQFQTTLEILEEIKKRSDKIKDNQTKIVSLILNGDVEEAKKKAKTLDHKVFTEYLK